MDQTTTVNGKSYKNGKRVNTIIRVGNQYMYIDANGKVNNMGMSQEDLRENLEAESLNEGETLHLHLPGHTKGDLATGITPSMHNKSMNNPNGGSKRATRHRNKRSNKRSNKSHKK